MGAPPRPLRAGAGREDSAGGELVLRSARLNLSRPARMMHDTEGNIMAVIQNI
jgi:hypothetical protein